MKAKAVIRLRFSSERHLETVFRALEPETRKPATMRSKAHLNCEDKFLFLKVEAKDTVALRAALNAYLRWINAVLSMLETLKTQ